MVQPTAVEPAVEAARVTSAAPPRPISSPASLSLRTTGLPSSTSSFSQTARRQPRIAPIQPTPVKSSSAPATSPTVPALATRLLMPSWSEMPGTWSAIDLSILCSCSSESSTAPIAAPTAISGKSARKLMKVIAAASLVQWTRSSRSYERQACVNISRATSGPMTGRFFSQSMTCAYPPGRGKPVYGPGRAGAGVVSGRARGRHGRTDQLHHRAAGVDGDQHPVRPRRNPAGGTLTGRRPPVRTGPSAPAR